MLLSMADWYLNLTIFERASLFLVIACFCIVMFACFKSLTSSHSHVTWYRGIHATPAFQFIMWIGVLPLIIPAIILFIRRRRALRSASYIGNLRSRVFHKRDCEYQMKIHSDLLRFPLNSKEEGESLRFKPCNWCFPGRG